MDYSFTGSCLTRSMEVTSARKLSFAVGATPRIAHRLRSYLGYEKYQSDNGEANGKAGDETEEV